MELQSSDTGDGSVLDMSGQKLSEMLPLINTRPAVLIYNKNNITRITHLEYCEQYLEQLSLTENRLTDMGGVSRLHNLSILNLANNGISCIEGLKNLVNLTWLNLSTNNIKVMENLGGAVQLQHLDLSHNCITSISLITRLSRLKTLLLHDNQLSSLKMFPRCLLHNLVILSLAQNNLFDLTEFASLACLPRLGQLSLMDNPCVHPTLGATNFDYRPYILNWCENLMVVDGYVITEKERRQAIWLRVQGKGRSFKTGQHGQLTEYLGVACPLPDDTAQDSSDTEEDVLPAIGSSPKDPSAWNKGINNDARQMVDQAIVHLQQHSQEKIVQLNSGQLVDHSHRASAWQEGEAAEKLTPQIVEKHSLKDMQLEDVTSSDELTSLLDAETRYLPINSEMIMSPLKPLHLGTSPTAHPQESPSTGTHPEDIPERDTSSSSVLPSSCDFPHQQESRYMQYENRPIKPLNQNRRIAANFAISPKMQAIKPQPSNSRPQPHCSRWSSREPVSTEVTLNNSNNSSSSVSSNSVTSELRLLKDILQSKRSKRSGMRRSHSDHVHGDTNKDQVRSSVSSSLYKSEYSPDKYVSGRRSTRNGGSREYSGERRRDSGSRRKGVDEGDSAASEAETLAATKLQAFWRGFRTRHKDPAVLLLKQELRDRRAEAHIRHLTEELTRQRHLYEEEKQLRHLQMDALKYLWQEVQSLQSWKSEVLCSREEVINHKHLAEEAKSDRSTSEVATTLDNRKSQSHQPQLSQLSVDTGQQVSSSLSESQLETTCQSLQKQVSQLQEVLTSISNYVFQGGVITADQDNTGTSCDIRLSVDTEDQLHVAHTGDTSTEPHTGSSRCHTSPPSPTAPPTPGIPTPPDNLRIFQRTATSGVLQWQPSVIYGNSGKLSNKPIIGYRVYSNGCAKGMVAGTQRKALVDGLTRTNTYRLTVRAVAALGDSADSNVVIVHAEDEDTPQSPPPGDDDDNPDPRRGKQPDHTPPGGSPPGGSTQPSGGSTGGSRRSSQSSSSGSVTHEDGATCLHGSSGSMDTLERDSSPGPLHSSTPTTRSQAELNCDVDSGCWTSPMSADKRQQVSPVFALQQKDERRSRISQSPDRQQRHLDAKQKFVTDDQKSTLIVDDDRAGPTLLSSSPRIQEALIKRLEVGRDKGMLVEMKMAAKMHKRKTGPEVSLPLKAVRSSTDNDMKPGDRPDVTNYIDSTVSQADDVKGMSHDVVTDTVHSKIPVYHCKRSASKPTDTDTDTDTQGKGKDTVTKDDRVVSNDASEGVKGTCRKPSVKRQSLPSRRDGSGERETEGVDRRRGSVSSRSSSHSRRSSVDSTTGSHSVTTDRVGRNDSEDSLSGHDSLQNSPSSQQRKDSSSDSTVPGRRTIGHSPQRKHQKAMKDGKISTEVSPNTTQTLDDSELENVLLEAPVAAAPDISSRRRRTSGSPMRPSDKVAVSERLREDGSLRRSAVTDSRQKPHRDHAGGDSCTRRSPAVEQAECSSTRCGDGLPTEHSRLPMTRQTSTRRSAREPHRKIRTAQTKKRSCSVGAVNGRPETGDRLTQKPPVLKTPSRDVVGSKPTRRRAYSEHSSPARSVEGRQGRSPNRGCSPCTGKSGSCQEKVTVTVKTHRRSHSDMSAIPVLSKQHPDSSTTPKDWKPVPPNTPKQGISSPRIRRSSSFSKATRGTGEMEGQYALRQCVSLEMLKAAKSQEAAAAAASSNHDIVSSLPPSPTSTSTKTSSPPALGASAQTYVAVETGIPRPQPGRAKTKSSEVVAASSTRPANAKVSPKERRINLGTKAADLFAKLQQRLSANKS